MIENTELWKTVFVVLFGIAAVLFMIFHERRENRLIQNDAIAQSIYSAAELNDVSRLVTLNDVYGSKVIRQDSDKNQLSTLHHAASVGSLEVMQYLLSSEIGANANLARLNSFTPLHSASMHGHRAAVEFLLNSGADINAQTQPQKYTPLHSAAYGGHTSIIDLLLSHGANGELLNYHDERPVDTAQRQHQTESVRVFEQAMN